LPWFRRRKQSSDVAAVSPAAPPVEVQPDRIAPSAPAASEGAGATIDPNRPKRRRGSRGGKGRKKPGAAAAEGTATTATPAKPAPREPRKQPERKAVSQRQERRRSEASGNRRRREPQRRAPLPAAKRELIVSVDVGEQRVAVLEDDKVAEVYLERPERRSIAGNIYLGQVDNVLPGMEAAFVEIGLEKNGFLYVDEIVGPEIERGHGRKIQDLISKGQTILVQAVKDPMKTKGARLTTQISLPGRFVVFVPQGEGLGVSRRLDDDERSRLKEILKKLAVKEGERRAEAVYELFVSTLPSPAFTAKDVLDVYLHRGSFETVLADEDAEQDHDQEVLGEDERREVLIDEGDIVDDVERERGEKGGKSRGRRAVVGVVALLLMGAARHAAYAAGQAAAVAHVAAHELGAAAYAIKAARAAAPEGKHEIAGRLECRWQHDQLPDAIRELVLDDQRLRNDICWSVFDC